MNGMSLKRIECLHLLMLDCGVDKSLQAVAQQEAAYWRNHKVVGHVTNKKLGIVESKKKKKSLH